MFLDLLFAKTILIWVSTLSPLLTTKVPYANSLDLDEMLIKLASHPDPSCLTFKQQITKFIQH